MAGAPVESSQFAVLRSLGGRSGLILDTCNRLRLMRGRFFFFFFYPSVQILSALCGRQPDREPPKSQLVVHLVTARPRPQQLQEWALPVLGNSLSQTSGHSPIPPSFGSRALWGTPSAGACGVGDHPTPDLSRRASESRSASEKSK
jgi:hypothetical protein